MVNPPLTETYVDDLAMESGPAAVVEMPTISQSVADPTEEDQSQEGTGSNEAKETTHLDLVPAVSTQSADNLVVSENQTNLTALIREEKKRISEQDLDIGIPSGNPDFAAQMVSWERFKTIYLAKKIRLQLIPNEYAFNILVSRPLTAMDASSASASHPSAIDVVDITPNDSFSFPLPQVIQELKSPATPSNAESDRFVLLVWSGLRWELFGNFCEEEDMPENLLISSDAVSELDATENMEEDQEEAAFYTGLQLPDPPSVNAETEEKRDEGVGQRLDEQIKEMNVTLMDLKAELANNRVSLTPKPPARRPIQQSQMKRYQPSPRMRQKRGKLKRLRQSNARLSSELKEMAEEKKMWMKENEDLKKDKEELIGERDALKLQLSALNQGDIPYLYLLNHKCILVFSF